MNLLHFGVKQLNIDRTMGVLFHLHGTMQNTLTWRVFADSNIYTHCYGHSLNLAASDTIKICTVLNKAVDIMYEMSKLIKHSPKRDAKTSN